MKIDFLQKSADNTRLVLIFTGWSFGRETGADIKIPGWDVCVVSDYTDLEFNMPILDDYYTIYVFAWSLGVFVADRILPKDKITAAFAVNGTVTPVDSAEGIDPGIFDGTTKGLNPRNVLKFRMRMAGTREVYNELEKENPVDLSDGNIETLRCQLKNIRKEAAAKQECPHLDWTRAYISEEDRIFPPANQARAWEKDPDIQIVRLNMPHYVKISDIVKSVIADTEKVSKRFEKASVSYDAHAIAQYSIAVKLAGMAREMHPDIGGKILEIGCGTGLFTREYAHVFRPLEAVFVDIAETGLFGIAERERYVKEDAETWIESEDETYDAILSASAMQWFADTPRFLHNCRKRLRPGGLLVLSSFLPGNIGELDTTRPCPIIYHDIGTLKNWLDRDFEDIRIESEAIKVEFQSYREMLMHLKHTGVGGSAPASGGTQNMKEVRTLTYRPVYIAARRNLNGTD